MNEFYVWIITESTQAYYGLLITPARVDISMKVVDVLCRGRACLIRSVLVNTCQEQLVTHWRGAALTFKLPNVFLQLSRNAITAAFGFSFITSLQSLCLQRVHGMVIMVNFPFWTSALHWAAVTTHESPGTYTSQSIASLWELCVFFLVSFITSVFKCNVGSRQCSDQLLAFL